MPEITDPSVLAALNGSQPASGGVYRLPADPLAVRRDDRAQNADDRAAAAAVRAAANDARSAANEAARLQLERERLSDQQAKDAREAARSATPITAKERADAIAAYQSGASLDRIIRDIRAKGELGPDATSGLAGLQDFLPTAANQSYNDAANAARGFAGTALGFTSSQLNTPAEVEAALGAYLPNASRFDSTNQGRLERLQALGNDARNRAVAVLGGIPDVNGNILPAENNSVWQQTYSTPRPQLTTAPAGSTTQAQPINPQMQAELDAYIQQNGRNTTEAGLRDFIGGLYAKYGGQPGPGVDEYARATANALQRGGQINTNIPAQTVPLSGVDQIRNSAVNNPLGAGVVGLANAGSLGGVSLLDSLTGGNRVRDLGDASTGNAIGMGVGEVLGSIGGTAGLGAIGRSTIGRAIPSALGGGARAQLGRDLATDAIYSGVYGANQGQDPLASTALGLGGSAIGRGVGRGIGAAVGGARLSPAVEYLRSRNIPLTTGQTLGGVTKGLEDMWTSIPGVGQLINARRGEGFDAFNRAAFNDAGAPIGASVNDIGEQGVASLKAQVGDAYNAATAGRTVPLDPQFSTDLGDIATSASRLPSDYAAAFDTIGERRIQPLLDRGQMTGSDYQQSIRGLRAARRDAQNVGSTGFDQEYRDVLTDAMRALEGNMRRGGGADVVEALDAAGAANRNLGTISDAVRSAAGGSQTGELFRFTPSQLQRAGMRTEAKYPGPRPFSELADTGQQVLPSSVPDSGTAGRLAAFALPATLGGTGAGLGAYLDGTNGASSGAGTGLALGALLALGGTKAGQRTLNAAIAGRPEALKKVGEAITKRRGMFGSGLVPLSLSVDR